MQRTERIIPGHVHSVTGEKTADTKIITNPTHADFRPWLGKARKIVHIMHPYGSMSGRLRRFHKGVMTVRAHSQEVNQFHLSYVTFTAADVSEINISADYAPTIWLHKTRVSV